MLSTFILDVAFASLAGIINWFPVGTGLPTEVHTAVSALGAYLGLLDALVPISTLTTVVGLVFVLEIIIFGFKSLKWIGSHIPFVGGRG